MQEASDSHCKSKKSHCATQRQTNRTDIRKKYTVVHNMPAGGRVTNPWATNGERRDDGSGGVNEKPCNCTRVFLILVFQTWAPRGQWCVEWNPLKTWLFQRRHQWQLKTRVSLLINVWERSETWTDAKWRAFILKNKNTDVCTTQTTVYFQRNLWFITKLQTNTEPLHFWNSFNDPQKSLSK